MDRPLQAGKLGAQAQRMGCETPMQERFTRSPGWPSKGTRGVRGQWLRSGPQGETTPLPPSSSLSPLLSHYPIPSHPHPSPQTPPPLLSLSWFIPIFSGMAYPRGPPVPSTAAAVAAAEPGPWLGCGGERRRVNQHRRPEGNGSGGEGRIRGSGGSDKRGRGHQLPGSLWEFSQASAQPCSLKIRAPAVYTAFSQTFNSCRLQRSSGRSTTNSH